AFVGDDRVEHAFYGDEIALRAAVRAGIGVADGAGEIALVGDFQNSQTRVLHVVRAQAAIVGAAPVHLGVEPQRHFRRLDVDLSACAPVLRIGGDQDLRGAVL